MSELRLTGSLSQFRLDYYAWSRDLAWPKKVGLALIMAGLTGLAAQVRIPLPHTPVPVTGQVFAVLLSGVLLGGAWGGLSQALYVGLGAAGAPWFSGWSGGVTLGPTAGYLMGFIPAAVLVGWVSDRFVRARSFVPQVLLMAAGAATILVFGAAAFSLFTRADFKTTFLMAVYPFIAVDSVKAIAAAAISSTLLPKPVGEARASSRR